MKNKSVQEKELVIWNIFIKLVEYDELKPSFVGVWVDWTELGVNKKPDETGLIPRWLYIVALISLN